MPTARVTGDASLEFEQFIRDFRQNLRLSAIARCGDWHAADDLVQEALVILHRRWHHIQPQSRAAYTRIVISHLATHMRRSGHWQHESLTDALPELARSSPEEEIIDRLALENALDNLPKRQRNTLYLRYWRGLTTGEIAHILQVPTGTVRSDLARATTRLRRILKTRFR